ncbi:MAG: FtsB family cell division protein [Candidatus Rokuibacteriota bacterium]
MKRYRLGIVAGLLLAVGLAAFGVKESMRVWRMEQELRALERDVATMGARQKQLEEQAERLRSDPSYIEKLAREEMGMVRQGETVLKFPSQK